MDDPSVDRELLGRISAARYEAESFLALHASDYFATPANGKIMTEFMEKNGLPLNAENFEIAFEQLKASGELLPGREAVARMSTEEFKQFAADHGQPVLDGFGNVIGHNLPPAYSAPATDYNRPRQLSRYTQSRLPAHPEDVQRNPSKREFAMWDADRQRDWLIERGFWGKDLPSFLQ